MSRKGSPGAFTDRAHNRPVPDRLRRRGALCLYLRLGGVSRVLVDCGRPQPGALLAYLREVGEVDSLRPLSRHLRPAGLGGRGECWLGVLDLVRGLALRPGGSWVF